jgi:hypothetical protein
MDLLTKITNIVPLEDLQTLSVLVIGQPASGKTFLTGIAQPKQRVIHTDDYKELGFLESMYSVMEDVKQSGRTWVEGVQGYRLLRKGVELNCYFPDIVINLSISDKQREIIYNAERDPAKLKYLQSFEKANNKILADYADYMALSSHKKPLWVDILNDW